MSLMRRNKLRIIPNVARKLTSEKCEVISPQNLPIKIENETNNIKKEFISNNTKEIPKEYSENSPTIISDKLIQPTLCNVDSDQKTTNNSNTVNYTSLSFPGGENQTTSGVESVADSNNHTGINCNLPSNLQLSCKEECLKSIERVESLCMSIVTDDDTNFKQKDKDAKTGLKSPSKKVKITSHDNSIEDSITDKHATLNSNKEKQMSKANVSVSPKKCSKKFQNLSRGGKENAVVSKLNDSSIKSNNEAENSSENIEIKKEKEKTKSFLNPSRKHKPKSLEAKNSPYFERKNEYRSKLTPAGELEKSKMTMFDLIFWNPNSNPMPQTRNDKEVVVRDNENDQNELAAARIEEQKAEEEGLDITNESSKSDDKNSLNDSVQNNDPQEDPVDASESEEESATLAPQVKIGPNGELVVDEKSLLIQTTAAKNRDKVFSTAEVIEEDNNSSHYGKWSKRKKKSTEWTVKETARFYKALSTVGTDFSLMSMILNWRTRAELKIKFKKEEKINRNLIDMALSDSTQFDFSIFDESDYDPEEDRKKSKEAEKAEAKKKKEEERKERKRGRERERKIKLEQEKLDKSSKKKLKNMYKKIKRRKRSKLVVKEEPIETQKRKRKLSVTIDPQEVICEVVFSSQKSVENNCTVNENVASTDEMVFSPVDPLSCIPVVDVGEDETLTITQTRILSYDENAFEEKEERCTKKLKNECNNSCEPLPVNYTEVKEGLLDIGASQLTFATETDEPSEGLSTEGYKSPSAVHLPIPSYGSVDENLVLMPGVDPDNPSNKIFHVFRLTKDSSTNPDTSSESASASNNNNNNSGL